MPEDVSWSPLFRFREQFFQSFCTKFWSLPFTWDHWPTTFSISFFKSQSRITMCNLHWCYTFCTGITLFALVLHLNCTALSQSESSNFFMCIIKHLIIYTIKLLNSDWLRKECKMCNTDAKSVIRCKSHIEILDYDCLINNRGFQIKRAPMMAQLVAQFFPDCVIRVRFFCSTISKFFYIYY